MNDTNYIVCSVKIREDKIDDVAYMSALQREMIEALRDKVMKDNLGTIGEVEIDQSERQLDYSEGPDEIVPFYLRTYRLRVTP